MANISAAKKKVVIRQAREHLKHAQDKLELIDFEVSESNRFIELSYDSIDSALNRLNRARLLIEQNK